MSFKTSINIRFDVGKDEFIRRYIPTSSHTEVLKGILDGFIKNTNRSHIIVGAYGTGKSLIATVISTIVSKSASLEHIEKLISKFNYFDDYIADQIRKVIEDDRRYIPILLTGNEGRFRQALLSTIVKSLQKEDIEIVLPGISKKILESVNKWRSDYPETYSSFINKLNAVGKNIKRWTEDIRCQNEKEILHFIKLFPSLTSGTVFEADYNESFLAQMEYITETLDRNNLGLIIVHDEFGRFLQSLNSTNLDETMQDIQDLAELTNRSRSLQTILITHKSLRQYFSVIHREIAKEFQRIEKRFRQYSIVSDQATFLKIAEVILSENLQDKPTVSSDQYKVVIANLREYSLFPSLVPHERERIIVESMYPLHPITLFVLPALSSVFGQNERTLFTFLESEETGGLINHISKTDSYFLAHQLFDYFFSDVNENDVDEEVSQHILLYKKSIARIPSEAVDKKLAFDILKLISTWNLCGLQKEQKLSTKFLAFAMQMETHILEPILNILSQQKVIRYNRLSGYWELHSGSSIDLQGIITKKRMEYTTTTEDVINSLKNNISRKYYFPERYNDEKEMTRFAKVEFLLESDLNKFNTVKTLNNGSDINLYYVFPEDMGTLEIESIIMKLPATDKDVFAVHPNPIESIMSEVNECNIIEALMSDKKLLSEDKGIREELILLLKEANHVIERYLSKLINFDESIIWITSKSLKQISNDVELSDLLSEKCDSLYRQTPVIINDSFNRMFASSQQKAGAKTLIDHIIKNPSVEGFGVEGNGPAYAIYAAVFKNNANFDRNINELDYEKIRYEPYRLLRQKIVKMLDDKPKGNFADIINIFTSKPFGIRMPVIPVLLVSMLRDRWTEIMLYRNQIFVPGLNGDKLYEILEEEGAENYQYTYEKIDEKFISFFNNIEKHFSDYIDMRLQGTNNSRLIQICATLIKWLRSLPRFTQISNRVKQDFASIRDIIRRTEVNPQQAITELNEVFCNGKFKELLRVKDYAEGFLDETLVEIIQFVHESTRTANVHELMKWASNRHEYLKKNNELIKGLLANDRNEKWIESFLESFTGVMVVDWSDKTLEKFKHEFLRSYTEIVSFEEFESSESDKSINKEVDFVTIGVGEKTKVITKVNFSVKTKTVYTNIDRIIRNAGRNIPKNELEYMVYLLLEKYVE